MKNLWIISFILFLGSFFGQKIITLSINQPPEFGYAIDKITNTIVSSVTMELSAEKKSLGESVKLI